MTAPESNERPSRIYAGIAGDDWSRPPGAGAERDGACILRGHGPHGARFESGGNVGGSPGRGTGLLALRMADAIAPAGTVTVITADQEATATIRRRRTRSTVTARRPRTGKEMRHLIEATIEAHRLAVAQAAGTDGDGRFRHLPGLLGDGSPLSDTGRRSGRFQGTVALPDASPAWTGPTAACQPPGGIAPGAVVEVPQIRASICGLRARWWPVRGRGHHDQGFFDNPYWHWHVDRRFTDGTMEQALAAAARADNASPAHSVIASTRVRPACGPDERAAPDRAKRYYRLGDGTAAPYSLGGMLNALDPASWQRTAPLACRRPDPEGHPQLPDGHGSALEALQAHYAGRPWGRARRCTHQGYPLAGLRPDRHGFIHCPLHGLLFDAATGEAVGLDDAIGCWRALHRCR